MFHYKGGDHFYCGFGPMLLADNSARSCVMQLYQGIVDPPWCQTKLRDTLVQPFTRLYNGSWIFSALNERVSVVLKCPDGETPTGLMGFGVINLAEGCTITSHDFWYPHTFAGVIDINLDFGDRGWDDADFHTDESIGLNDHEHHEHHDDHHEEEEIEEDDDNDDAIEILNDIDSDPPLVIAAIQAEELTVPTTEKTTEETIGSQSTEEEDKGTNAQALLEFLNANADRLAGTPGQDEEVEDDENTTIKYDTLVKLTERN